jgi:hypothetical protein
MTKLPPCSIPCPKCGASDISRRHLMPNDNAQLGLSGGPGRSSDFVDRSMNWKHPVLLECISHSCRVCGYYWDTAFLPVEPDGDVIKWILQGAKS